MADVFDPSILNYYQRAMFERMDDTQKAAWEKLSVEEKTEVMAMHTGQGFVSHDIAPDRPLLPKPKPEYISSRKMLDVLWHRSRWAPVDDAFDRGLEYAITTDPDMIEFQNWIMAVLALGLLPLSVKADDGSYRDARISDAAYPGLAGALLKNMPVSCHVRTVAGREHLFTAIAPTVLADRELWFKRSDVEALPCDDAAVARAFDKLADAEANSADSAETAAAINSAMGWNAGTSDDAAVAPTTAIPAASREAVAPPAEPSPETVSASRGRPKTADVLAYEKALLATLVDGGRGVTNAKELKDLAEEKLIAAGNGGKDKRDRGLVPSPNTALRSAEKLWDAYMRGHDLIEPT